MGLFSDQKKCRRDPQCADDPPQTSSMAPLKSAGPPARVKGGAAPRKGGLHSVDEHMNHIRDVGKVNTKPAVLRGLVEERMKRDPNMSLSDMLRHVRSYNL